jgi:hypothetical protein
MGARYCVTVCDLGILLDQAAEPVPPQNPGTCAFGRRILLPAGRVLVQRPVRPMGAVMVGVLAEDKPQVPVAGEVRSIRGKGPADGDLHLLRLRRPGSEEDVISKWIRRTLNPATKVIIRAEPTGAVSRLQRLTVTLEDMVCPECNNPWMSRRPPPST